MERCLCCCSRFNGRSKSTRALSCSAGHSLCKTCTPHFIRSQLSSNVCPIVCVICKAEFADTALNESMSRKQQEKYEEMLDVRSHAKDSIYLTCQNPQCGSVRNVLVTPASNGASTVFPCLKCPQSTCYVCLTTLPPRQAEEHSTGCSEFAGIKRDFDRAIAHGTAFKCPKCGIRGRKAYGCNAIHCDCGVIWCYLCEQKVARNNGHECTFHWTHQTCYMNLENLHRFKTCQLLHQVYLEHGKEKFRRMWNKYPAVRAHGYTLKEIEKDHKASQWVEMLQIIVLLLALAVIAKIAAMYCITAP